MTAHELTNIIECVISLLILGGLWYFLVPDYRCDKFRQDMFDLRDEMFDFIANSEIGFENQAYIELRLLMNALIRFAHRLTLLQVLVLVTFHPKEATDPLDFSERLGRGLGGLKRGATRDALKKYHQRAMCLVGLHLLNGSLVVLVLTTPFRLFLALNRWMAGRASWPPSLSRFAIAGHERALNATVGRLPMRQLEKCAMEYEKSAEEERLVAAI